MQFFGPKNNESDSLMRTKVTRGLRPVSMFVMLAASVSAYAGQSVCEPDLITRPAPVEPGPDGYPVELEGDQVESVGDETVTLKGNALMTRGAETLSGDELTYYRQTDEVEGKGNVVLRTQTGDRLESSYVKFQVETHIGRADDVEYRIAERGGRKSKKRRDKHDGRDLSDDLGEQPEEDKKEKYRNDPTKAVVKARGSADQAHFEGHDVTRMENVTYTTCVEGDDSVLLSAKEITLDQGTGRGQAKNMKIRFKGVPIFYFPRVSFPISDERKTGFLFPSVGAQEGSGFVLETPYYWNIAPNYDFTLYPRLYTSRGVQVGGEFRYLTEDSEGVLYGEYLPSDDEFGEDRSAFTYKHEHDFSRRIDGEIDVQYVSDNEYFDDFSNDIDISSSTRLPQEARISYSGDIWDLRARLFAYQIVDDNILDVNEPFDRLPQLTAKAEYEYDPLGLDFGFESEAVNFIHDINNEGWRINAKPSISREFENVWGYIEPKFSVQHINYFLDNVAPGEDDNPSATVPIFSVDSGIYLERRTSWFGEPFVQTLEPRAFYVFIPEDNQDDLPNFDTGAINLNNFSNIWREDRFFGRDRIGDTNQVTLGLTSRMLEADTGDEWMQASLGMIFFLEDREVNLAEGEVLDDSTSDFLAEYRAKLSNRWRSKGFLQWDTQEDEVREGRFDLRYKQEARRYIQLSYRFSRDRTEQVSLESQWRIAPRWHVLFDDRYSLRDDENLETKVGLEYDGCCWRVRGFFQRRAQSDDTFRNAIIFELELTGLARIRAGV